MPSSPLQWVRGASAYYIAAGDYTVSKSIGQDGPRYAAWYRPNRVLPVCLSPRGGHVSPDTAKADAQLHADTGRIARLVAA